MISIKSLFSKVHFCNFLPLYKDCSPFSANNLLYFVPYYCPAITTILSITALNKTALSTISPFHWKSGIIEINKNTFYPVVNFKFSITIGAFRFPRFSLNIAINTKRTFNIRLNKFILIKFFSHVHRMDQGFVGLM